MATKKVLRYRGENRNANIVAFFELVLDGTRVVGAFGRTDTTTNETSYYERVGERFDTPAAAAQRFEKLVASRGRYKDTKRTEEEVPAGDETVAKAASNATLETEVLTARDEAAASSVYADWLQQQGDVRGELASLFLHGKDADARAWIAQNPTRLFGDADVALDNELYDLVWRHGFLRGASLKRSSVDSKTDLAKLTRTFLALPVSRLVTALRFGLAGYESDNDWSGTLAAVAASPQARTIRSLRFDDYTYEDCEISWTAFGDFSPHWSAFPMLEELQIRAGEGGTLGDIDLPSLKKFVRVSGGLGADEIASIVNAKWPRLEHLEVWFGHHDYGAAGTLESIVAWFAPGHLPKSLAHLGIVNCEFVGDVLEPLAKSPLLAQLKSLDFSKGTLVDEQCDALLRHADAFQHLAVIDLSENHLNERGAEIARRLPNAIVDGQRYEDDEDRRYVALGE